jgi:protein gp37
MGVTVENGDYACRIKDLRQTGAAVKFISFEPLVGPVSHVSLNGIDWAIVGGESGPGARPMQPEWVVEIRDRCLTERVPFFFKQWGGVNKKANGRTLDNRTWDEVPVYERRSERREITRVRCTGVFP